VRSPQEYSGDLIAPPGYEQEGAQRGGHIPTAKSIPWASAVRDFNPLCPNVLLYWTMVRYAIGRGYERFDFGRSKAGTGAFAFKKNWGFEPEWLEYEYHFRTGETMPDKNPLNPKYRLFIETWKKLPLPLANLIGPWIIRGLG